MSPDPYKQYASPYLAMGNNWISRVDPDGGFDWKKDKNGNIVYDSNLTAENADFMLGEGETYLGETHFEDNIFYHSNGLINNFDTGEFFQAFDHGLSEVTVGPGATLSFNEQLANTVEPLIGSPYVWGANGPDCFDCSGTLIYAIRQVLNPNFTDTNADGLFRNYSVSTDGGRGTLVFYDYTSDGVIDHVTTIMNDTHMLHPSQGNGVLERRELDYLDNYTDRRGGTSYRRELDWNRINN